MQRILYFFKKQIQRAGVVSCLMATALVLVATVLISQQMNVDASSHREAPLISSDPFVDNTDTYVFVSPTNPDNLVLVASWIPFEGPEGGPNYYEWDDNAAYEIHVDNNGDAVADYTYMLTSATMVQNPLTFLYNVGGIGADGTNWNRQQRYTLQEVSADGTETLIDNMLAPPVNIGSKSTADYETLADNFIYTVNNNGDDISVYAGQTDDPFWVDLQVFDLLTLRGQDAPIGYTDGNNSPIDSLAGFNVHTLVVEVPISRLTQGDEPVLGVWASAHRSSMRVLNGLEGLTTAAPTGTQFTVALTGDAVIPPPGDGDGVGEAVITFYPEDIQVCHTLTTENIGAPTGGHIHTGNVDASGPLFIGLFSMSTNVDSNCVGADDGVTIEAINAVLDNPAGHYINIHNEAFPGGAIRGQLSAEPDEVEMLGPPGLETHSGDMIQVSRLGMPLVNEAVLPYALKDAFNGLMPSQDLGVYTDPTLGPILQESVENPELGRLLCGLYGVPMPGDSDGNCNTEFNVGEPRSGRGDIFDIFLTGMVLANEFTIQTADGATTLPAGFNVNRPADAVPAEMIRINTAIKGNTCSPTPSRLGVLGGDACGFPNGRRLIDDVVEIELLAVAGAAYAVLDGRDADFSFNADFIGVLTDGVDMNDMPFRSDFPYVSAAQSGQEHLHANAGANVPVQTEDTPTPMATNTSMPASSTPMPTSTPSKTDDVQEPTDLDEVTEPIDWVRIFLPFVLR